jgi:hypothetical protein
VFLLNSGKKWKNSGKKPRIPLITPITELDWHPRYPRHPRFQCRAGFVPVALLRGDLVPFRVFRGSATPRFHEPPHYDVCPACQGHEAILCESFGQPGAFAVARAGAAVIL